MSLIVNLVGQLPRPWSKAIARLQWRNPLFKLGFEWAANQASITQSPWNAQVLAVPRERTDLEGAVEKLTNSIG